MFKVGTICIGQGFIYSTGRNDMECEVIGPLAQRTSTGEVSGLAYDCLCYSVRWADDSVTYTRPHHLRKKPRPGETTSGEDGILALFKETMPVPTPVNHPIKETK